MTFIHHILFFDTDKGRINIYKNILGNIDCLSFENIDFETLIHKTKIHIAISPANSYLSMTGGIDKIYSDLFPGIEHALRTKMIEKKYAKSGVEFKGTNYILPIGKAIIAETGDKHCYFIMASPTMVTARDINGTNNVYHCMKAILAKLQLIERPVIVACPCLGTGIGNLSTEESANQIKKAFDNFK